MIKKEIINYSTMNKKYLNWKWKSFLIVSNQIESDPN